MSKNLIIFASFPFTPFDKKSFNILPVFPGYWLYRTGTISLELIYLVTDCQIVFPRECCKVFRSVNIFKMIAIRNKIYSRTYLPNPTGGFRIYQDDRFIVTNIRSKSD